MSKRVKVELTEHDVALVCGVLEAVMHEDIEPEHIRTLVDRLDKASMESGTMVETGRGLEFADDRVMNYYSAVFGLTQEATARRNA